MKQKLKDLSLLAIIVFSFVYLLAYPFEISFNIGKAIRLCCFSVIPSLFMYSCFANFITEIIMIREPKSKAVVFLSKLFSLPVCLIPACIFGLFCGAPSGSISVCRLYGEGKCSKQDAENALVLSNNCSAAFITSIVASVLDNRAFAYIILLSNIATTIIVYMLLFRQKSLNKVISNKVKRKKTISQTITDCISSSVFSCITLCGYVIFFYTLSAIISEKVIRLINVIGDFKKISAVIKCSIMSFFEISSGVIGSSQIDGNERIAFVCSAVAFCGVSIFLQVKSISEKQGLSAAKFMLSKFFCALISPIISIILILILPQKAVSASFTVIRTSGGIGMGETASALICTVIFIIAVFILFHLDKNNKIKP